MNQTPAPAAGAIAPVRVPLAAIDLAMALSFAAAALVLYLSLGQGILYGDGAEFMLLLRDGAAGHKNHLAYVPLLRLCAAIGGVFGWSPFVSARLLSQAGAAFGVGVFFLVSRRFGLRRSEAAWVTALIGSAPSVIFFATVVEVHAPYFAFLSVAWLAAAHLARTPSVPRGVLLGVACAAAYCGHASGLVLPGPLLLVVWLMTERATTLLRPALACIATHTALVMAVPWALSHAGQVASPAGAARFLAWWKMDVFSHPSAALLVLWDEWLLAYLPMSILWLAAFVRRRRAAFVTLLTLLPYLALSIALLAVYREFGAYQQAVVWLIAWLTTTLWRPPVRIAAVLAGLVIGSLKVHATDDRARVLAYAQGLAEVSGAAAPLLLAGGLGDFEHCFIAQPAVAFASLAAARYADAATVTAAASELDARIAAHRQGGGRVFLTADSIDLLGRSSKTPESGFAALFKHLQDHYEHRVVVAKGFRAVELTPRP